MPVDAVHLWLLTRVLFCCTRGYGWNAHPAFPAPSVLSWVVYASTRAPRAARRDAAVEIDDHAFAHGIELSVRSAHADIGGHHQILKRVGLVGEAPAFADRRGVAGGADHDLRALIGALARHLGEHAVVADDERDLGALRSLDHGNADVAGLPWLDRNPGMEFPVVELDRAVIVDDQAGIVGIAFGVMLH